MEDQLYEVVQVECQHVQHILRVLSVRMLELEIVGMLMHSDSLPVPWIRSVVDEAAVAVIVEMEYLSQDSARSVMLHDDEHHGV